jgi:hypothetical protein
MRSAKIFVTGVGGLFALLLVFTYPRESVLVCASGLALLVLLGFCIPVPRWIASGQSGLHDSRDGRPRINPFPSLTVFETEIRNLWILILSPLYAMGVAAIAIGHGEKYLPDALWSGFTSVFSIKAGQWITAAAVYFAWWWLQERWLLRKAEAVIGFSAAEMGGHGVSYQYLDGDGERRAGTAYVWGTITSSFPVFMHTKDPDFSKPGFGFLFHRFSETDARNVPAKAMRQAQRRIAMGVSARTQALRKLLGQNGKPEREIAEY